MSSAAILAANLRRHRTALGISQQALAEKAGLSRIGYRDIETGSATPRIDTLQRIADALGVSIPSLLAPVRELTHVRFRAQKRMIKRENLLAEVARWLDDYVELEEILGLEQPWALGDLADRLRRSRRVGLERARYAAAEAREALGLSDKDSIRDICGLLEDHGVKILPASVQSEGFFGLSVGPEDHGPAVVVNTWDRITVERWIFTAAHELAHLLLHPHAYDVTETDEVKNEEKEADAFAGHFLMPQSLFEKEWDEAAGLGFVDRVFKVKRIFHVSWQTVVYRFSEPMPPSKRQALWRKFNEDYQRQYGQALTRLSEPDALPPEEFKTGRPVARAADEPARLDENDFQEDRLLRLVRRGFEAQKLSLGRAAEILGLTVVGMRALASSWVG